MPDRGGKKIGFFTDGPSFDGSTPSRKALGGSETALIQAARALAVQGHTVTVLNNCAHPGMHDGVWYLPARSFLPRAAATIYDVFIVSRFAGFFLVPIKAGLKVLWNHDTLDQPQALRQVADRIDMFFVLSRFHRDHFLTRIPALEDRMVVTRNGVDFDLIDRCAHGVAKDPNKIIYASRPERGLKVLLENIWPELSAARPEARLYICGYEVSSSDLAPGLPELYRHLDDLIRESPRIISWGRSRRKSITVIWPNRP